MTQRDILFRRICDIKYTVLIGNLYANRLEMISNIIDTVVLFIMSSAFSSFWLWEGHSKLLGGIMLIAVFAQIATSRFGLQLKAKRIKIISILLHSLYGSVKQKWFALERARAKDDEYGLLEDEIDALERLYISLVDSDVKRVKKFEEIATNLMNEQVSADFHTN